MVLREQEKQSKSAMFLEHEELRNSLNTSVDPCTNFYNYVCSGFRNSNEIRDYEMSYGNFRALENQVANQIECKKRIFVFVASSRF